MSDSLSPGSDLMIDDDLDNVSVSNEDLSAAEAKCGLVVDAAADAKILARPVRGNGGIIKLPASGSIGSNADPRIRHKASSLQSFAGNSTPTFNQPAKFSIKRTVPNVFGTSSFGENPAVSTPFNFSFPSPSTKQAQVKGTTKFAFGSARLTPTSGPASPSSPHAENEASGVDDELNRYMMMKETQSAKMKMEEEKMLRIEKMIELKKTKQKQQETMDTQGNLLSMKETDLAKQTKELQKQTAMVMQMQQNILMEKRNNEEEKRRLEDQNRILELQQKVHNLERLATEKQSLEISQGLDRFSNRPVRERVGFRQSVGIMNRVGVKRMAGDLINDGRGFHGKEEMKDARKRRFMDGRSKEFDDHVNEGKTKTKGAKKYNCAKLPDDLVLTEFTDQGPVKREELREEGRIRREIAKREVDEDENDPFETREVDEDDDLDRYENEEDMDPDLILTEFSDNGPVKAGSVDITSTSGK